ASARADEAKAIAALRKQGAEVLRDDKVKDSPVVVRFPGGSAKAVDPRPLGELPALTRLDLADTPAKDGDLAHLAGLARLEDLLLGGTGITDKGVEAIRKLGSLRLLDLSDTKVTPRGLARLGALGKLEQIDLALMEKGDDLLGDAVMPALA